LKLGPIFSIRQLSVGPTVNLNFNNIGDSGAAALARLRESTTLATLRLSLRSNSLAHRSVTAICCDE